MAIRISKKEKLKAAWRGLIYGDYKLGKTTLACGAPDPVVLTGEGGEGKFEVRRVVFDEITTKGGKKVERYIPKTWAEVTAALEEIRREGLGGETLVLDGFGALEKLAMASIVGVEKDEKGRVLPALNWNYGMGDEILLNRIREALNVLESIWNEQRVNILVVCHEKMTKGGDERGEHKYMGPALYATNKGNVAGLIAGWVDWIAYLQMEEIDVKIGETQQGAVVKRKPTGRRLLHLRPSDAYLAGFRGDGPDATIPLPPTAPTLAYPTASPMSPWRAFWSQVEAGPLDPVKVRAEFEVELAELAKTDAERAAKGATWRDDAARTTRDLWAWTRAERERRGVALAPAPSKAA